MSALVAIDKTTSRVASDTIDIGLVIPLSGPAGIFGPSCEACATLAIDEINATRGLLGRQLRARVVDGGTAPDRVAAEVEALVATEQIQAVAGWHISAVRQAITPRIGGRVPYIYTPLYEGGERTPGVFLTGETPTRQVLPAMLWMERELGVRSWCIVGDDYVWPRVSAAVARRFAARRSLEIRDEVFVRLGTTTFDWVLDRIERSRADGVLMFLVGTDAVVFNRAFAARGLQTEVVRFSPLMEENMLLATGSASTRDLYAAAGYFETLATADSLDFSGRYARRFGIDAPPLSSPAESCYEGIMLLQHLVEQAGTLVEAELSRSANMLAYESPRGTVQMRGNHLDQRVYLARAEDLEFSVLAQLPTC